MTAAPFEGRNYPPVRGAISRRGVACSLVLVNCMWAVSAVTEGVDQAERKEILARYLDHARRFEEAAQRRGGNGGGEVVPLHAPPVPAA